MNFLLLIVIPVVFSFCSANLCDHPFQETPGGKCLFNPKVILRGTWEEGQRICRWLDEKSRLVEIRGYEELEDVTSYLLENDADCSQWPSGGPWIGAVEVQDTNQFIWSSDNSTVVIENWLQGQPNNPTSGDGAMMACEFSFQWMDKARHTELPVLCELPPRAKCPAQFTAVGDTCYHLGYSRTTWDLAQDYCHSLAPNGKLVELETLEEINSVTDFLNENNDPDREFWTGAEERDAHDHFFWASSGKLVLITPWYNGYAPDQDAEDAIYITFGSPNLSRHWNAYPKSSTVFFELCEADPADL